MWKVTSTEVSEDHNIRQKTKTKHIKRITVRRQKSIMNILKDYCSRFMEMKRLFMCFKIQRTELFTQLCCTILIL